jgi:demethylmenaquinone methyltransferase/2-methoxy-6-polyprenyl-1,4-benzoquinol methylase
MSGVSPGGAMASAETLRAYYARRAATYDRVYLKPERQAELRAMEAWLSGPFAGRKVLELACGTGWWTRHGARDARAWLATDLNPETLALARAKAMPDSVGFAQVDACTLAGLGPQRFDATFAGCWWSHVPLARLPGWLTARG